MKTILVTVVLIVLAIAAGWLTFSKSRDKTTVTIETKEIKKDTKEAIQAGKEWLEDRDATKPEKDEGR
jgi:uncharacterized protein YxeA